jgi:hypothetical protein
MVVWSLSWKTKMTDRPAPGHAPARGTDTQSSNKFPDLTVHERIRVGCGRYDWFFKTGDQCLVERLRITIERMKILSPDCLNAIMGWLADLSYPWCPAQVATKSMPRLQGLAEIGDYINRSR